jgi:hypothetical protein
MCKPMPLEIIKYHKYMKFYLDVESPLFGLFELGFMIDELNGSVITKGYLLGIKQYGNTYKDSIGAHVEPKGIYLRWIT